MDYFHHATTNYSSSSTTLSSSSSVANNNGNYNEKKNKGCGGGNGNGNGKRSSKGGPGVKLSTDPQSVAARERRHRISDRFKTLQSLVPGGAKMDTVSMLEEAIHYVKFLKTQIWLHQNMINHVDDDPSSSAHAMLFSAVGSAPSDHHQQAVYAVQNGVENVVQPQQMTTLQLPTESCFQGQEMMYLDEYTKY